jgi:tripartite-type tricarboxylate transporter receptor subunit TctC
MKKSISRLLGLCLTAVTCMASAQDTVTRLIIAFPPGGPVDFVARTIALQLGKELKQQVIVDNRPGANGAIAANVVLQAHADGHTLWLTSTGAVTINPTLYEKLGYNVQRDFAPVSLVTNNAELLVVQPANAAKNATDFIAKLKASKMQLAIASTGVGSVPHMAIEQLRSATGLDILHVPYKGAAPAVTDLMGGQVTAMFGDVAGVIPYVRGGTLKAIGIAAPHRSVALPNLPTLVEQGLPNIDSNNWFGLFVNAKTPPAMVAALNTAIRNTLADPGVHERLSSAGSEPAYSTPAALAELVKSDTAKWGKLIHQASIKVE